MAAHYSNQRGISPGSSSSVSISFRTLGALPGSGHRKKSEFCFYRLRPSISIQRFSRTKYQFVKISGTRVWQSFHIRNNMHCATIGRNCHRGFPSENEFDHEPFWLSMIKDVGWSLKSLAIFLSEQPSQLRYIEWPTFQNTLKTSCLTLVLVAVLIVALSTVDSALCYILTLLLRKAT